MTGSHGVSDPQTLTQNVTWKQDCDAETTSFTLRGENSGWVGVGFVEDSEFDDSTNMKNADVYIFYFNGTTGEVAWRNGFGKNGNAEPVTQNTSAIVGTPHGKQNGTAIEVTFQRAWAPVSSTHADLCKPLRMLFAKGPKVSVALLFFVPTAALLFSAPTAALLFFVSISNFTHLDLRLQ